MKQKNPLVSFVVPTHNNINTLEQTLVCLSNQTYSNTEIIVVNDGSVDDTKQILKSYEYRDIILINLPGNFGHSLASNVGIARAKGDFLGLMDDDIWIDPNWTETILDIMHGLPSDVSIVQPKVIENNQVSRTNKGYTQIIQTCGVLAKTAHIQEIGGYDESYFAWVNDMELAANLLNQGYRIYCDPSVEVIHKSTAWSGGELSPIKTYYYTRNYVWYYWKYYGKISSHFYILSHFLFAGRRAIENETFSSFVKGAIASFKLFKKYYFDERIEDSNLEYTLFTDKPFRKLIKKVRD